MMLELLTFVMVTCMFVPFAIDKAGAVVKFVKEKTADLSEKL